MIECVIFAHCIFWKASEKDGLFACRSGQLETSLSLVIRSFYQVRVSVEESHIQ